MADRRHTLPPELVRLLDNAAHPGAQDDAWAALVAKYSRLLITVAREVVVDRDATMDAYAFVLGRLREDDCRRLRGFVADGRSSFTTWLVVVARRMCVDHYRQRYGRTSRAIGDPSLARGARLSRRRLFDLATVGIDLTTLIDAGAPDPDTALRTVQRDRILACAIDNLEPSDRLLLKLRFEDDLSAREIASILRLPSPFHVYRRLATVCGSLRRMLVARGVEDAVP
jgi:RNA polymerase sigma factor (sigma-70 family)